MNIEVFSDVVCPWCYVGTMRLERVLAEMGEQAEVRYRPFILNPDAPPEGIDVPAMLRRKYGVEPRMAQARVESEAKKSGFDLDLSKQTRGYSTIKAQTLIRLAEQKGTQRELVRALFHAYFDEAKNIADDMVLVDLASAHGFARAEAQQAIENQQELERTKREADEAMRMGVTGVPLFVFGELGALSGAQPEAVFRDAISQARA